MKRYLLFIFLFSITAFLISCTKTATKDNDNISKPDSTENNVELTNNSDTAKDIIKSMSKEEFPSIDGSTATIMLSLAVYQYATGATLEEAENTIVHTKTSNSYISLVDKNVDLILAYEPTKEILDNYSDELIIKPIGKDALIFLKNKDNPVNTLTHEQIIDIYQGKITNWSEVGGFDKEIIPFQRAEDSGSQNLMLKLVMKDHEMMDAPTSLKPTEMGELIEYVAEYSNEDNALGYSVYYYTQNMNINDELAYLAVNDVLPSKETIMNSTYPYINEFYAVIRKDEPTTSNAYIIFDWLTSTNGQSLIEGLGYVPVK